MKYLMTGGCGFLGSNLAAAVLAEGHTLLVFDNLSRFGSEVNLEWLQAQGQLEFVHADIKNQSAVADAIRSFKPDVIFHLAGQVAMTTSLEDPVLDFETNARGTLNVLEAVRQFAKHAIVIYSSTNKVYGDLDWVAYEEAATRYVAPDYANGFNEAIPLAFSSPYGCSKGCADQYMLDYAKMYGLRTVVLRHSSMYGGRQFSTYDQGWVGWFCQKALDLQKNEQIEPFSISGNGKQVRDILHAEDMKNLYFSILESIDSAQGQVFNIGGGMKNSLSLLELFALLEHYLSVKMRYRQLPARNADQKIFVADITKANKLLHWQPKITPKQGIVSMLEWLK